ncbi:M50 family metallopeptidase [Thioalkalivibrio sp. ALgr3]|uniref:M50 family metallopeptidase n=1 Tax=Thioalkalivibrio sp. ALgr3 TaxID=1239292 RepID=UPI00037AB3F6|nr:M50 family metallopeptidase [Thioalkalivibrio sp. ALgr3]
MDYFFALALTFLLFHLSIAAHEGGHAAFGWMRGHRPDEAVIGWGFPLQFQLRSIPVKIGMFPMAGAVEFRELFEADNAKGNRRLARDKFLIALGGPVGSLVAALGFFAVGGIDPERASVWGVFGVINVLIAVMNLAPVPPLDGWRILEAGLELKGIRVWRDREQRDRVYRAGFFIAVAAMIVAIPFLVGIRESVA